MPEHIGTHLDAPVHFVAAGTTVDQIPAERLVVAAHVIDVRAQCEENRDFTLEVDAVDVYEHTFGRIGQGSAVLMATGWDERLGDRERYYGGPTVPEHHFPGFGRSAAEALVDRGIVGLGTDAASIDAGDSRDFVVHSLTMAAGLWHLEGLINLTSLPATGALLFVGVLPIDSGSGAPARVIAVLSGETEGL